MGRDEDLTKKWEHALAAKHEFVVGPPALIEMVRGMVRHGKETFSEDKKTYVWMKEHKLEVLELPRPFMAGILHINLPAKSGVTPTHYQQLIDMVVNSASLDEFVKRCNAPDCSWGKMELLDPIHEGQIEKELRALEDLVKQGKGLGIAERLSMTFGTPDHRPDPVVISVRFSTAIKYVETSMQKLIRGAKPRKNDRGLYVDWELLMYLADPDIRFLTNEDFSGEISKSPQKIRIVKPCTLS